MPYDQTPTMSQVINSGLNAVKSATGFYVDSVKEKARSDLLYMQAQYESDEHDFLMQLQNSNNYNDYQKKLDNFMNEMQKNTNNNKSKYYCDNAFTAKKANEMFASRKVALQNKVNEVVNTKRIQEALTRDQDTISLNMKNLPAQEALNANAAIYANQYSNGMIDYNTYHNSLMKLKDAQLDYSINNLFNEGVDAAITAGKTKEEYFQEILNNNPDLLNLDVREISSSVAGPEYWNGTSVLSKEDIKQQQKNEKQEQKLLDKNNKALEHAGKVADKNGIDPLNLLYDYERNESDATIQDQETNTPEKTVNNSVSTSVPTDNEYLKKIKKDCEQKYDALVAAYQEKNYTKLSEMYAQLGTLQDPLQKLNYCKNALNLINTMKGNKLEEAKRISFVKLFQAEIDDLNKGGSGSGKTSYSSYSTIIKNLPEMFMAGIKDGTYNYYDAAEDLQDAANERYWSTGGVWNETKNFKDDETRKEGYYAENYGKFEINKILNCDELEKAFKNDPTYDTLYLKYKQTVKEVEKDLSKEDIEKRKYTPDATSILLQFACDFVAEAGNKKLTPEEIEKFNSMLNGVNLDWLGKNLKGYNNTSDKGIMKTIDLTHNNDFAFTSVQDTYNKIRGDTSDIGTDKEDIIWASPEAKTKMDDIANTQKPVIAEILGVDPEELGEHSYMRTKYDVTNIPEWTTKDGTKYHLEKTEDGKSYHVVDSKGNVYKGKTVKEKQEEYKAAKADARKEKRLAKKEQQELRNKRVSLIQGMSYEDFKNFIDSGDFTPEEKEKYKNLFGTSDVWFQTGTQGIVDVLENAGFFAK